MERIECSFCANYSKKDVHKGESFLEHEVKKDAQEIIKAFQDLNAKYPDTIKFCPFCGKKVA